MDIASSPSRPPSNNMGVTSADLAPWKDKSNSEDDRQVTECSFDWYQCTFPGDPRLPHQAITRITAKRSRGKRYRVNLPRLPELDALLTELKTRPRREGVETVLVNMHGKSWSPTGDGLNSSFDDARAKANGGKGIFHLEIDPVTGEETKLAKRLHDMRGSFATRLMTHPTARLTDREIADLMGWSEAQVSEIRRRYVDDSAIVVALGRRLAGK